MSNETPGFDFGSETSYSPHMVADRVIWPMVDSLWHGDWRRESHEGHNFGFPKQIKREDKTIDVTLEAECYMLAEEDGITTLTRSATLFVEEFATVHNQQIMLGGARFAMEQLTDPASEHYDDRAVFEWPEGDDDELVVKNGTSYWFDTEGEWEMDLYRRIEGPFSHINVPVSEAELGGMSMDKLWLLDLEKIALGCVALRASKSIMEAFPVIQSHAVTAH